MHVNGEEVAGVNGGALAVGMGMGNGVKGAHSSWACEVVGWKEARGT